MEGRSTRQSRLKWVAETISRDDYTESMESRIPTRLAANFRETPEGGAWLDRLPDVLRSLEHLWALNARRG
jgi:hypothetical protein